MQETIPQINVLSTAKTSNWSHVCTVLVGVGIAILMIAIPYTYWNQPYQIYAITYYLQAVLAIWPAVMAWRIFRSATINRRTAAFLFSGVVGFIVQVLGTVPIVHATPQATPLLLVIPQSISYIAIVAGYATLFSIRKFIWSRIGRDIVDIIMIMSISDGAMRIILILLQVNLNWTSIVYISQIRTTLSIAIVCWFTILYFRYAQKPNLRFTRPWIIGSLAFILSDAFFFVSIAARQIKDIPFRPIHFFWLSQSLTLIHYMLWVFMLYRISLQPLEFQFHKPIVPPPSINPQASSLRQVITIGIAFGIGIVLVILDRSIPWTTISTLVCFVVIVAARESIITYENTRRSQQNQQNAHQVELFVNKIVHDLAPPIQAMKSVVGHQHEEQNSQSPELRAQVTFLEAFVQHAREYVEARQMTLDFQPVQLIEICRDSVQTQRPRANAKEVSIVQNIDVEQPTIWGDPLAIRRVLDNLLANAVGIAPPQSQVIITITQYSDALISITVTDQGPGIEPSALASIFEPEMLRTKQYKPSQTGTGLGLGLAIVKELVAASHGTCDVVSTLGSGTTFRVCLPVFQREQDQNNKLHS